MSTLAQRFWRALTMTPRDGTALPAERGRQGYGLGRRFWSALLGVRLPPRSAVPPAAPGNPLTEPVVRGSRIRLPRFDRTAVRLAATEEPERPTARWTAAGTSFTLRESGPGEIELLVRRDGAAPPGRVVPVDVAADGGNLRYFLVLAAGDGGGSVGVLRLAAAAGWLDVTVDADVPVADLDGADPATRTAIARSVAATPDPAMPVWAAIVASLPDGHPLRRVIRDAAG